MRIIAPSYIVCAVVSSHPRRSTSALLLLLDHKHKGGHVHWLPLCVYFRIALAQSSTAKRNNEMASVAARGCGNSLLNIRNQGIELAKAAIAADAEASASQTTAAWIKALNLYKRAGQYFVTYLKHDKSGAGHDIIKQRFKGYLARAEQIKEIVKQQEPGNIPMPEKADATSAKEADADGTGESKEEREIDTNFDLEAELGNIVGLPAVKQQLRDYKHQLELDKRRRALGFNVNTFVPEHMAFLGPPGTGKTTIARLVAKILHSVGITAKKDIVEVQRSDLVQGYIGQTAEKTRKVIERSRGGVLFIDEAYRLVPKDTSGKDFGIEAIDELMSVMNDGDPIMIFAGYERDMQRFFGANEGLHRRISQQFVFQNMSIPDLVKLFRIIIGKSPFLFADDVTDEWLTTVIDERTHPAQRALFNGGLVKPVLKRAKANLDRRLTLTSASEENIMVLTRPDIADALDQIPRTMLNDNEQRK